MTFQERPFFKGEMIAVRYGQNCWMLARVVKDSKPHQRVKIRKYSRKSDRWHKGTPSVDRSIIADPIRQLKWNWQGVVVEGTGRDITSPSLRRDLNRLSREMSKYL